MQLQEAEGVVPSTITKWQGLCPACMELPKATSQGQESVQEEREGKM